MKLDPELVSADGCDLMTEGFVWLTISMGHTFELGNDPIEPFTPFIIRPHDRLMPVLPTPNPVVPKSEREASEQPLRVQTSGASTMNSAELLWAPETADEVLNP